MKKAELVKELRSYTGAGVITATKLTRFLGQKNVDRIKKKFLSDLHPVVGKAYFISEVAEELIRRGA